MASHNHGVIKGLRRKDVPTNPLSSALTESSKSKFQLTTVMPPGASSAVRGEGAHGFMI